LVKNDPKDYKKDSPTTSGRAQAPNKINEVNTMLLSWSRPIGERRKQ